MCTEPLMGNDGGNSEFHQHVNETAVDSRSGSERICHMRNRVRQRASSALWGARLGNDLAYPAGNQWPDERSKTHLREQRRRKRAEFIAILPCDMNVIEPADLQV